MFIHKCLVTVAIPLKLFILLYGSLHWQVLILWIICNVLNNCYYYERGRLGF